MAFVRQKTVKGRRYYQLVRNYREEGKHRQEVLCHLGAHDSLDTAIDEENIDVAYKVARYKKAISNWDNQAAIARRATWNHTGQNVLPEHEARLRWQVWWHRTESEQQRDAEDENERLLLFWSLEYHAAKKQVARYEALASSCPARLNKLRKLRQDYYLQKHPQSGS